MFGLEVWMAVLSKRVWNFTNHRQLNCKILVNIKVQKDTFWLCHFTKPPTTGSMQMTDKKKVTFQNKMSASLVLHKEICEKY